MTQEKPAATCGRLRLSDGTKRRLWAESGGYCQNPQCGTRLFSDAADVDFAEMAHIIPASAGGPRDGQGSTLSPLDRAHHSNVAVLCANCHTVVDKAPELYPADLLRAWKFRHEDALQRMFGTPQFSTRHEARKFIEPMLDENRAVFATYGPRENDFSESRSAQWRRHVASTIIPNNSVIGRALKRNRDLLTGSEQATADAFAIHALEFAARHLWGEQTTGSTRFPSAMRTILEEDLP